MYVLGKFFLMGCKQTGAVKASLFIHLFFAYVGDLAVCEHGGRVLKYEKKKV